MFLILFCTFLFIPLVKSSDISEPKEVNKIMEEVDLTVEKDVKKSKLFSLYYRYLSEIINGKINL